MILQIPIFSFQKKNPEFGGSKFKMDVRMILRIPIFSFQKKNPEFGTSKFKMDVRMIPEFSIFFIFLFNLLNHGQ